MSAKKENALRALKSIGDRLIREARLNLDRSGVKDRGRLRNSLDYKITEEGGSTIIRLVANDYAKFIDEGRLPTSRGGSGKKPGVVRTEMEAWVRRNRFKLNSRRGQFKGLKDYQVRSLAFAISQKIHNEGFQSAAKGFLTNAFKTIEPYMDSALVNAYKNDIEKEIERILKS